MFLPLKSELFIFIIQGACISGTPFKIEGCNHETAGHVVVEIRELCKVFGRCTVELPAIFCSFIGMALKLKIEVGERIDRALLGIGKSAGKPPKNPVRELVVWPKIAGEIIHVA